jgi:hypothetical protein
LFESESLRWPGFVEFDDVNGKVLTYSAQDRIYKVFDLKNYTMLYSISDENVQEIKIRLVLKCNFSGQRWSHVFCGGYEYPVLTKVMSSDNCNCNVSAQASCCLSLIGHKVMCH